MTKINPKERLSASEALTHDWIAKYAEVCEEVPEPHQHKEYLEKYFKKNAHFYLEYQA